MVRCRDAAVVHNECPGGRRRTPLQQGCVVYRLGGCHGTREVEVGRYASCPEDDRNSVGVSTFGGPA